MKLPVLLLACAIMPLRAADTISLRADSWPPYNESPGSATEGYLIDLARAIYTPLGYTIDYRLMPWARTLDEVRAGRIDGAVGAAGEESLRMPQQMMGVSNNAIFAPIKATWTYDGIASLQGRRLGCIKDYAYEPELDNYIAANGGDSGKVFLSTGDDALSRLFQLIVAGRLDAFVENPIVVAYQLRGAQSAHAGTLKQIGVTGAASPLSIGFSQTPRGEKLAAELDAGMQRLRKSGELARILARYGVPDWQSDSP